MAKAPRLHLVGHVDIPVVEASGLAVRTTRDGATRVLAVGDRTTEVAVADVSEDGQLTWSVIDLRDLAGWPSMSNDSQFEAIAADGDSLVAVMREDPPVVLVGDASTRELVCRIVLDAAPALVGMWDEANSRGEGLVLLRGGRLLVAKEKHPPALVEFAPPGEAARGVGRDDFLSDGEPWAAPAGDTIYSAVAMWQLTGEASDHCSDISALGVSDERDLWLLSDQSRSAARLDLDQPLAPAGGEITEFAEMWRLPKHTHKPEGMAALGSGRFLVAMDTDSTMSNGLIVSPSP